MRAEGIGAWAGYVIGRTLAVGLVLLIVGVLGYAVARADSSVIGTTVLTAIAALASFVLTKNYEFQKQREAALAEKKRAVYRELLASWQKLMVDAKSDNPKPLAAEFLETVYGNAFDAVLYGSEKVIQKYAEFRAPRGERDPVDLARDLANLLLAMREDVTGKGITLPTETILRTFMNLSDEQVAIVGLRDFVSNNPKKAIEILANASKAKAKQ